VGLFSFVYFGLTGTISTQVLQTLQGSSLFIFTVSRFPQIMKNWKGKSTGQLAFPTFFLNFVGCIARIFTTLKELDDTIVLAGYIVGLFLNGIILAQIILYGDKNKEIRDKKTK